MGGLLHSILEGSRSLILPRISGGTVALEGEFPHQVQLTYNGQHFCGGSIISSILILTAAHCLINKRTDNIRVFAGKHHRTVFDNTEQSRRVRQMILHERYNTINHENDIAIIELESELDFNVYTKSVLVPKDRRVLNTTAETSGWGSVPELSQHLATTLRKVIVEIHDDRYCERKWGLSFKSGMMCAGIGIRDSCGGDSGGPVTCDHLRYPGKKFVCGITSFGVGGCGNADYPGVYTDVAEYYNWIQIKTSGIRGRANCPKAYFSCSNLNCVPQSSTCDHFDDCGDESDENCLTTSFQCSSGKKIDRKYKCDGVDDCGDNSDENYCSGADVESNNFDRLSAVDLQSQLVQFYRSKKERLGQLITSGVLARLR
ncbi:unnamed protein product [Allacma fusca]|uniref:limulus clotting factor C n=1 Tax=Allacma fusca TaxID=39272 RepID=A0A8J2L4N3_9HEXA|nr:unnamed protein product [Allacma fusca]